MLISSRGRYALLVMIDLAGHRGGLVPGRQIAERLELSQKYLERILRTLAEAGLIEGSHGKGGGYRLLRSPADYTAGEILRAAEGTLACLGEDVQLTPAETASGVSEVYRRLDAQIRAALDAVTLSSLTAAAAGCRIHKACKAGHQHEKRHHPRRNRDTHCYNSSYLSKSFVLFQGTRASDHIKPPLAGQYTARDTRAQQGISGHFLQF